MTKPTWDNVAYKYHQSVGDTGDVNHSRFLNPVIQELLGDVKDKQILDLACGQGYFSRILAKKGAIVVGSDISGKLLDLARKSEQENPLGINYVLEDSADLKSCASESFDLIISNVAFHDIENIRGTIKECYRVLKPKGSLVFSIMHPMKGSHVKGNDGNGYYVKLYRYLSEIQSPHDMFSEDSGVIYYHRPIELYMQELISTGFLISGFREVISEYSNGKKVTDEAKLAYKKEIPLFLVIKATKC